ncbi:hypothetical protein DYB32_004345 [Aphanomyces invadans]|uniref:WW domain-containing protein n=1 Tax=Aphanomyces invadans TaxID=157072 RepID=A0A418AXW2_9STRA|nr:hypothetical protein DYB32_004345 [Aphanomyces invadans]
MMEAEAAAEEDQAHGSGNGYLWILPSPPQPVAGDDDETQQPQRFWFEVTSFCLQDNNDIEYLKHLLSTNSSLITSADDEGNSLLLRKNDDIVYILLQFAASVECMNHDMETPAQVAMKNRHITTTTMLQTVVSRGTGTWAMQFNEYSEDDAAMLALSTQPSAVDESIAISWVQCTTDEGQPYYYNTVTFESVWELPNDTTRASGACHQEVLSEEATPGPRDHLPICMVPTICPLYEMDNPDVHEKELIRRKKEREVRRSNRTKLQPKAALSR